jgi:hypothetical protein
MNAETKLRTAPSIYGHMISLGVGHSIAIYERNREAYVAEFQDGGARLEYASSWFRFHAGGLRYCHNRRAALRSSMPLTPEILEKIERLHAQGEARQERVLAVPRTIVAAARRYWINVMSRLRGRASNTGQTFG